MSDVDLLAPIREMHGVVARSWRTLRGLIQQARPNQLADHVRRLDRLGLLHIVTQPKTRTRLADVSWTAPPDPVPVVDELERSDEGRRESLPDNWSTLSMTELRAVADAMELTGWGLVWAPREEVLRDVIGARDRSDAQCRLLVYQDDVLDDLKKCLGDVTHSSLTEPSVALQQGIRSYEGACPFPAQAISATVLTSLVTPDFEDPDLVRIGARWRRTDPVKSPMLAFRRNTLLRAGALALSGYGPGRGNGVPSLFHPYATSDRFDLTAFTQANALAGLMLGVGFLRDLQAVDERGH